MLAFFKYSGLLLGGLQYQNIYDLFCRQNRMRNPSREGFFFTTNITVKCLI